MPGGALGVGPVPLNCVDGVRVNMALAYLANTTVAVQPCTVVTQILLAGSRAVGVRAVRGGQPVTYHAEDVVLSCGAIKSPHVLMLSGIGPAAMLRENGIDVVEDLPGVGQGFTDHPAAIVLYDVDDEPPAPSSRPLVQVGLHWTAEGSGAPGDLELIVTATPSGGRAGFSCQLNRPQSRGSIALASADPSRQPIIRYGYLRDATDLRRLAEGLRLSAELLRQRPYTAIGARRTGPSDDELGDDRALDGWIRANITTAIHMASSCRMGPPGDPGAVVDQRCRVYGIDGLRIVDTSVMPEVVGCGTSATATMIGERAAELFAEP
jgi:choline dehydrogenase-like flavoprotein